MWSLSNASTFLIQSPFSLSLGILTNYRFACFHEMSACQHRQNGSRGFYRCLGLTDTRKPANYKELLWAGVLCGFESKQLRVANDGITCVYLFCLVGCLFFGFFFFLFWTFWLFFFFSTNPFVWMRRTLNFHDFLLIAPDFHALW